MAFGYRQRGNFASCLTPILPGRPRHCPPPSYTSFITILSSLRPSFAPFLQCHSFLCFYSRLSLESVLLLFLTIQSIHRFRLCVWAALGPVAAIHSAHCFVVLFALIFQSITVPIGWCIPTSSPHQSLSIPILALAFWVLRCCSWVYRRISAYARLCVSLLLIYSS
ncbi:hypothetical protein DL93DRAFT_733156 [Clavulina sp. PMI_390]|nr:hypothetical protein DL93DRAFT_733156 [Clavulina sp. PMI_390]